MCSEHPNSEGRPPIEEILAEVAAHAEVADADHADRPLPGIEVTRRSRTTDADYGELARSYAVEPPRADEVRSIEFGPAYQARIAFVTAAARE